ncbi:MAG: hypothetical protein UZ21_OP11001000452 [Microgenomates bacterium OLB22]|nr:MAG: hypothetical protein UZ21_OP11001000452 [Microgenomates bacterium OLB22]
MDKTLALALAKLAKRGDGEIIDHLAGVLKRRSSGKDEDEGRRGIGFTQEQELALRTLMQLDNPLGNDALFSLILTADIDSRVKVFVIRNLIETKKDFFPKNMRAWIKSKLSMDSRDFDWQDFKFFQATCRISSADIRARSRKQLDDALEMFTKDGRSIAHTHKELCPSIPEDTFMQLWKFTGGNEELVAKFNSLYSVTKGTVFKEELLYGIVNILSANRQMLAKVVDQLARIDFVSQEGAEHMARLLKTVCFLTTIDNKLGQHDSPGVLAILDAQVDSLDQLNASFKEAVVYKIREVLPNDAIDAEKIQKLWEHWGNLDPIFVYASKMASSRYGTTLRLVAEMVAGMDPPTYDGWKKWRYNLSDRIVSSQVGHLTKKQLDVWKADHFAELGVIMIANSPRDLPDHIAGQIERAILEGHIYNPDVDDSDKYKFIQERLARTHESLVAHPEQRKQILADEIQLLQEDIARIDSIIRAASVTRLQQILSVFTAGQNVQVGKKTFDALRFLEQFLSKEQFLVIQSAMNAAVELKATTVEATTLLSTEIAQSLSDTVRNIEESFAQTMDSDIFQRCGLDKEQLKNSGQFYQKRQELKTLIDLYRLSKLNIQLIGKDMITERADKQSESITSVIDGLRKFFKDNLTFLQDIDNLQTALSMVENIGGNRRLAMIITDNPQILFQVGKYPIGCRSCQNYEGRPELNKALAGYVADAHTKAIFLIDLNKLSPETRQKIDARGFEEVKNTIPQQELLEASVGRSIAKLVQMHDGRPVLFLEPTYTQLHRADLNMNTFFDTFAELIVADPMGIQLVRGAGGESVTVPSSRNPSGQYEDAAAGNAGHAGMGIKMGSYTMPATIISRFIPVSKSDQELVTMISQSSH